MNRLRQLRKEQNLTQDSLGSILKLQKSAISKYEIGGLALSQELITKLCKIFNVSADYLLCLTDLRDGKSTISSKSNPSYSERRKEIITILDQNPSLEEDALSILRMLSKSRGGEK